MGGASDGATVYTTFTKLSAITPAATLALRLLKAYVFPILVGGLVALQQLKVFLFLDMPNYYSL